MSPTSITSLICCHRSRYALIAFPTSFTPLLVLISTTSCRRTFLTSQQTQLHTLLTVQVDRTIPIVAQSNSLLIIQAIDRCRYSSPSHFQLRGSTKATRHIQFTPPDELAASKMRYRVLSASNTLIITSFFTGLGILLAVLCVVGGISSDAYENSAIATVRPHLPSSTPS